MAQRVNPNIFRLGITKSWNYKYLEKKSTEQPKYDFNNLEIKKFIFKFFKDNNFNLYDSKINYSDNGSLQIFLSYYAIPTNKNSSKELFLSNTYYYSTTKQEQMLNYFILDSIEKSLASNSSETKLEFIKKKIQQTYFSYTLEHDCILDDSTNTFSEIKLEFFFNNFIESLTTFLGKKINIFVTFQELNKSFKRNLTAKSIEFIKRSLTKLNQYKDNDFFKEGVTTLYICSKYPNSADLLAEFLVRYLKKVKSKNFFLTFLQKALTVLKKEKQFKNNQIKIQIKGCLTKAARARKKVIKIANKLPVLSLKANIDYSEKVVYTLNGTIGVKVWVYNPD